MENLLFLGVPILKHVRVYQCYSNNLFGVVSIAQLVEVTDSAVLGSVVKGMSWNPAMGHIFQHLLAELIYYILSFQSFFNLYQFLILCSSQKYCCCKIIFLQRLISNFTCVLSESTKLLLANGIDVMQEKELNIRCVLL